VCEIKVFRKIYESCRDKLSGKVTTSSGKLSIVKVAKSQRFHLARNIVQKGKVGNTYRILVGKSLGKQPAGRLKIRW
jgi:hypothetical protein